MSKTPELIVERELRLAVVMYGGVSLAVYMNGVSQELLNLVRATAFNPTDPRRARYSDEELKGSALVYRELARLGVGVEGESGDHTSTEDPIRRRFVIDILSGTSAGGINAIFLAKALANGQSIDKLVELWLNKADIGLLINDADSRHDMDDLPKNRKPMSLLNGHRMYRELLDAFDDMDKTSSTTDKLVDEVDLYVTATALEGLPVRLQLGGGEIAKERRYRKSFHLERVDDRNDFERDDNPFLAFIANCTSAFPVAFEPMQYATMNSLLNMMRRTIPSQAGAIGAPGSPEIPDKWKGHFDEYEGNSDGPATPYLGPFADGGYLDNKPFSYAIDAIIGRRSGDSGLVERKLVYIEPDPERFTIKGDEKNYKPPTAIENALAVIRLRSYETIREDLLRIRDRNRLVDKVHSVVAGVDSDFQALNNDARTKLAYIIAARNTFNTRALDHVVCVFGSAYGGYHRLKVGQLTDELSQFVAINSQISPASDDFLAIRLLMRGWRNARYNPNPTGSVANSVGVKRRSKFRFLRVFDLSYRIRAIRLLMRGWRNEHYDPNPTGLVANPVGVKRRSEFRFLRAFDLSYRIRRGSFVIEQINRLGVLTPKKLADELGNKHPSICGGTTEGAIAAMDPKELMNAFDMLRSELAKVVWDLRFTRTKILSQKTNTINKVFPKYAEEMKRIAAAIMAEPTEQQRWTFVDSLIRDNHDLYRQLQAMQREVMILVKKASSIARKKCWDLLKTDDRPQLLKPLEIPKSPEELVRCIGRHYYTWYELYDSMVFPITYGSEVGEELSIVEPIRISPMTGRDDADSLARDRKLKPAGIAFGHFGAFLSPNWRAQDVLIGRMNAAEKLICTVLAGTPHDTKKYIKEAHKAILDEECSRKCSIVGQRLADEECARKSSIVGQRLADVCNVKTAEDRLACLKDKGLEPEELPPEHVVGWMARAAKVMGLMFKEVSEPQPVKKIATWLQYGGQILTGMVAVLMPHKWWGSIIRLWIPRLLIFAIALIIVGPLLGKEQVTGFGWTVLWVVLGFKTLTLLLRYYIKGRGSWVFRTITSLIALGIMVLMAIGINYFSDARKAIWAHVVQRFGW